MYRTRTNSKHLVCLNDEQGHFPGDKACLISMAICPRHPVANNGRSHPLPLSDISGISTYFRMPRFACILAPFNTPLSSIRQAIMIRTRIPTLASVARTVEIARAQPLLVGKVPLALAGPSKPLTRPFSSAPLRQSRARTAMVVPQVYTSTRGYAAEAGGRFNRSKPHFK